SLRLYLFASFWARISPFRERRRFSAPVLRPVPDVQNFNNFFGGTVHDNVGRADQFAGSFHLSGSANAGEGCQLLNAVDHRLSVDRIVILSSCIKSNAVVGG